MITAISGLRTSLHWLPVEPDWETRLACLRNEPAGAAAWAELTALAKTQLDPLQTTRLDRALQRLFADGPPDARTPVVRLAVLGSSSTSHLIAGLRVAALRRGVWLSAFEPPYGQYMQALLDPPHELRQFAPTDVLLAFDGASMARRVEPGLDHDQVQAIRAETIAHVRACWRLAQDRLGCGVVQQAVLPLTLPLLGEAEHRLAGSPTRFVTSINEAIRTAAAEDGVEILSLDTWAARLGAEAWHDPALWFRAKQEVRFEAAPLYGDLVMRVIAARRGLSSKALVLDLDNTLWGGVIGDDGLAGICVGQGDALGESFAAFQTYVRDLGRRGLILAACSKNDEANARLPFTDHPEMVLRMEDFAAFVANWDDKATNLRTIAAQLNIGLESLVFVDDNPFERNLVRKELPEVAVPEIPEEPALVAACLSEAGYFEGVNATEDDFRRKDQYRSNLVRAAVQAAATNLDTYLRDLDMTLYYSRVGPEMVARATQLINKTNQFNLTTRRYDEAALVAFGQASGTVLLQLRLTDRFGDNGVVALVIAQQEGQTLAIDTWLMSCRVLGRQVEAATLDILVGEARKRGATELVGVYRPTAKNGMVSGLYRSLGFELLDGMEGEETRWVLDLSVWQPRETPMVIVHLAPQIEHPVGVE